MKFSIVVNNYNYERFIAETIDSALEQDYPDVEVIVADDGSTDRSREIIESYGDRVKTIYQPNGGQRAAYNAGYSLVTGELVVFLDADDWLYPNACSVIAAAWRPGVSKVQFFLDLVDINGASLGRRVPRHMHSDGALEALCAFGIYGTAAGSGNAYPADYLRKIMPLDTTMRHMPADSEPILFAPAYGEIASIADSLGAYRIHKTVGSDPLLLNNMPTGIWPELARMQTDKIIVSKRLESLNIPHRKPMLMAPWEARLLMVCKRFGGPRPATVPDLPGGTSTWFAARSVWAWNVLSIGQRLLILGWMAAVRLLPRRMALRLAHMNREMAGHAAPAGSAAD